MDKNQFKSAIRSVSPFPFTKLEMTEYRDSRGFNTQLEVPSGLFYASLQSIKDTTEINKSGATTYEGKAYLYVHDDEVTLSRGDRFNDDKGSVWLVKNIIDDYSSLAGFKKFYVERVIL